MIKIKKINRPRNNNSQTVVNTAPAVEQITDYLPAVGDEVNGYTVKAVVDFVKGLKLGGVVIDIDTDGNIRFNGNIYATGFVSAMGAGTSDGGTASGGGLDESELWRILAGDANSRQILSQYLISALTPYLLTSNLQMLTIKRGGVTIGTYKADTAQSINIELPTFAEVRNKPTTLAGYGITDAMTTTAINSSINTVSAKVDNLQIGGRNYLKYSGASRTLNIADTTSAGYGNYSWEGIFQLYPTSDGVYLIRTTNTQLTISVDYEVVKCNVDNVQLKVQIIWSGWNTFAFSKKIGTADVGTKGRLHGSLTITTASTATQLRLMASGVTPTDEFEIKLKNWKLELGNKATDWTPAPEDVEEEITQTKTDIINGNVASATKIQNARSLWGNSFDGTKDINGQITIKQDYTSTYASDSGQLRILNTGYYANTSVPQYALGLGVHQNGYGEIQAGQPGIGTLPLFLQKNGGNVTIGGNSNRGYKLEVIGTIKGTTAFLGRLMVGYNTEDTNYAIKCDGRFYAGDDSEIYGLLTVGSLVASTYIEGQSLTILGSASITDLSCNIITSNTIKANIGIQSNGYVSAMASSASDGRFKTDVKNFNSLSILQRFTFISYRWRPEAQLISSELHDNTTNYGVIAQDADGIIDGLVYDAKTQVGTIKAVRYEKLIPIIAKGVQELNDEVTILRAENAKVRAENAKLRAEIDEIKRQIEKLWNRQF